MVVILGRLQEECKLRVSGNSALRRIFGPKRDEITAEYRKLHKEEPSDLYSSPNTYYSYYSGDKIEKNVRGRACRSYWGEKRFWWGKPEKNIHLEDLGTDGRVILK